ncbi:MAG: TetR/AcrR family transcriptional regulator [Deltaproteobacteria bacterium]|jgi:AcrR family transcriptional regulator|nr:TetR/AcrR family transcriptional regulator [Deltaproteobacteria bacterium]MBT6434276.1 TetR/AcrR family transcriptional regulator [Deltaproteobacteria bacterium]MBT6489091.1 TetR/AcrR family transcriptional regulator [Deltaproteobacteria bacterium]
MNATAKRKTQQERSAQTQHKILQATIDCLVEYGYGGMTTTQVCRTAGCSQGAIFKHFPTKAILVSSAVNELYQELVEQYREMFRAIPDDQDRLRESLNQLWELFQQPRLLVVYDLHTAARTDPELKSIMGPKEKAHRDSIRELAEELYPEASSSPFFVGAIDILLNAIQGAAVGSLALFQPEVHAQRMVALELVGRLFLEATSDN